MADFPAFEEANNPDGGAGALPGEEIDSNPNGLLVRHRSQLVTDAGGNDLLKVDHNGRIKVVAVFPPREVAPRQGSPSPRSRCRRCRPRSSRALTAPITSAS